MKKIIGWTLTGILVLLLVFMMDQRNEGNSSFTEEEYLPCLQQPLLSETELDSLAFRYLSILRYQKIRFDSLLAVMSWGDYRYIFTRDTLTKIIGMIEKEDLLVGKTDVDSFQQFVCLVKLYIYEKMGEKIGRMTISWNKDPGISGKSRITDPEILTRMAHLKKYDREIEDLKWFLILYPIHNTGK